MKLGVHKYTIITKSRLVIYTLDTNVMPIFRSSLVVKRRPSHIGLMYLMSTTAVRPSYMLLRGSKENERVLISGFAQVSPV